MGTRDRENRAVSALTCLAAVIGIATLLFVYQGYHRSLNEQAELRQWLTGTEESLGVQEEQIAALNGEIGSYADVAEKNRQERELFYSKAKELETKVLNGESDVKIAYLTFDDGPYWDTTHIFLDILDEYDIKATFFYLLKEDHDDIYQRVIDSGHTLANHSASHNLYGNAIYASVDTFIGEVEENRQFIQDKFGYTTNILRFPGGSPQARDLKWPIVERLREIGYGYVDWDTTTGDGKNSGTVEEYIHGVLDVSADYDVMVVLMHDYSVNTYKALPTIINGLKEQGFIFLPLFYESDKILK
ncbi:MAG: polysaccharide deacetylase family protein [Erysipelotrichaceae bacterium]|nr:polysaccharide deacetylase family protein [Erysipelotrichaceae bacterium]